MNENCYENWLKFFGSYDCLDIEDCKDCIFDFQCNRYQSKLSKDYAREKEN